MVFFFVDFPAHVVAFNNASVFESHYHVTGDGRRMTGGRTEVIDTFPCVDDKYLLKTIACVLPADIRAYAMKCYFYGLHGDQGHSPCARVFERKGKNSYKFIWRGDGCRGDARRSNRNSNRVLKQIRIRFGEYCGTINGKKKRKKNFGISTLWYQRKAPVPVRC